MLMLARRYRCSERSLALKVGFPIKLRKRFSLFRSLPFLMGTSWYSLLRGIAVQPFVETIGSIHSSSLYVLGASVRQRLSPQKYIRVLKLTQMSSADVRAECYEIEIAITSAQGLIVDSCKSRRNSYGALTS